MVCESNNFFKGFKNICLSIVDGLSVSFRGYECYEEENTKGFHQADGKSNVKIKYFLFAFHIQKS